MTKFTFRVDKEKIKRFRELKPEEKLEWLEEINEFINKFVPEEKRKRWYKLFR